MLSVRILDAWARTSVGLMAATAAAAVRAGISRITEHPFLCDQSGEPIRMARDARIPADLFGSERMVALASGPLEAACRSVLERLPGVRLSVFLALPEPRPGWTETMAKDLVDRLQRMLARLGAVEVIPSARGHAGALMAVEMGAAILSHRQADVCVVGGVDSYHEPATLAWLESNGQLLTPGARSGFLPGEGAGFLVLATDGLQRHLRTKAMGTILGVGSSFETAVIKSDRDTLGVGLARAIEQAAAMARPGVQKIGGLYCDLNGERYRSDEWGFVALRCHNVLLDATAYTSAVGSWGDVGAATGVLNLVLATQAWARGYAPHPSALVFGGSEAGQRCAVVAHQERTE
jgi:3-oxoacyl-[acyl-carrier-protein] synthase I